VGGEGGAKDYQYGGSKNDSTINITLANHEIMFNFNRRICARSACGVLDKGALGFLPINPSDIARED
jgi:hypothetical protein